MYLLFGGDDLEGVFSGCEDGSFDDPYCCCCSTELIDLVMLADCQLRLEKNIPSISKPNTSIPPKMEIFPAVD